VSPIYGYSAKSRRTAPRKSLLNHVKKGKGFGRENDPLGFLREGAAINRRSALPKTNLSKPEYRNLSGRSVSGPHQFVDAGFLAVIDRLAGRACYVAVATHDPWLAGEALKRLRSAHTPCGLELLFALPTRKPIQQAQAAGVAARFYVPYGHALLPYRLSELSRVPRILGWILYDLLLGRHGCHPQVSPTTS
jgi:hypothetical protein